MAIARSRNPLIPQALAFASAFVAARLLLNATAEPFGLLHPHRLLWEAPALLARPSQLAMLTALTTLGAVLTVASRHPITVGARRRWLVHVAVAGAVAGVATFFLLTAAWESLRIALMPEASKFLVRLKDYLFYGFPLAAGALSVRALVSQFDRTENAWTSPKRRPVNVPSQLTGDSR